MSPLIAIHLSPALAGSVRLSSLYSNSFASLSGGWCPALWLSRIHVSPLKQFMCLPVWVVVSGSLALSPLISIHLSPTMAGSVRLSDCLQFICLPLYKFICLPFWLVVPPNNLLLGCMFFGPGHPFFGPVHVFWT